MRGISDQTVIDRFWAKTKRTDGCWIWTGHRNRYGYGRISVGMDFEEMAHRFSWALHRGSIPAGSLVLHQCDVRACVRPDHLFLGTHADNTADMVSKGRTARGEQLPQAKLTENDVRAIRQLASMMTHAAIAEMYGVQQPAISRIVSRKRWAHIE